MGTHPIFESDFDCLTDRYHKMKLLFSILFATVVSRTLLEEVADVFKDDDDKDVVYSNTKLADTHLMRIFPKLSQMVDYRAAMKRQDSREYYALTQIPEDFFRIFVENLQNYIVNHMEKLPDLTLKDVFGTDKLEELALKNLVYIIILRLAQMKFLLLAVRT